MKINQFLKEFSREGSQKLTNQYTGTRQAMFVIAREKVQEFMRVGDVGLAEEDRELLSSIFAKGMMQGFSLGYGIGKVEAIIEKNIYL